MTPRSLLLGLLFVLCGIGNLYAQPRVHVTNQVITAAERDRLEAKRDSLTKLADAWKAEWIMQDPMDLDASNHNFVQSVWVDSCRLFAAPDSNSAILATLPLDEATYSLPGKSYDGYASGEEWHHVITYAEDTGYVRNGSISLHWYKVLDQSPLTITAGPVTAAAGEAWYQLLLKDAWENRLLDRMLFKRPIHEGGTYFHVRGIYYLTLPGTGEAFWVESSNAACPEYHDLRLIVVQNNQLREVAQANYGGEGGDFSYEYIYLPVLQRGGAVVHLPQGNPDYLIDHQRVQLDTVQLPARLQKFAEEIAVVISGSVSETDGENGEVLRTVSVSDRRYLRWNGGRFVRMRVR